MCEACGDIQPLEISSKRRRLWEMTDGWHCSVIGTCLTLSDLRSLGRKLKLQIDEAFPQDYQLHGFFASEAAKHEKAAKLLNKLLDKRHTLAIRRTRQLSDVAEIKAYWDASLDAGDIPGPYWALLSHPLACSKLCERMFADVHMLSHLVGASNRSDIRRLRSLEEVNDQLKERMRRMIIRHRSRLVAKNEALVASEERMQQLRSVSANCHPVIDQSSRNYDPGNVGPKVLKAFEESIARADALTREQTKKIEELSVLVEVMHEENHALEQEIVIQKQDEVLECSFDLGGRCLLYVGGRKPAVTRLKALVENWNGEFVHHDGGLEKSISELAGAIVRADAVVFPMDCVSHEAVNKVKRLCQQTMKPYVPLRSCGVGSLIAGLQSSPMTFPHLEGGGNP